MKVVGIGVSIMKSKNWYVLSGLNNIKVKYYIEIVSLSIKLMVFFSLSLNFVFLVFFISEFVFIEGVVFL